MRKGTTPIHHFTVDKDKVEIQFRAKFTDGSAVASNIMTATVLKILKGGEI